MIDVVTKAVADFTAVVRHFKEDADTDNLYNVDPDLIFVGGISAGAIAADPCGSLCFTLKHHHYIVRTEWKKAYIIMLLTMLVDLDHLLANPIFDPNRCSINFHPYDGLCDGWRMGNSF